MLITAAAAVVLDEDENEDAGVMKEAALLLECRQLVGGL